MLYRIPSKIRRNQIHKNLRWISFWREEFFGRVCFTEKLFGLTDAICRSIACFYTSIFRIMSDNPPKIMCIRKCFGRNPMITKRSMQIGNITVPIGYGICIWFNLAIKYFRRLHWTTLKNVEQNSHILPILKYTNRLRFIPKHICL